ncbi:hypothetical protein [Nonomuraea dietziae]|uniref:hypothetical protein n=1 Tax=Nonomuraea dietziae TaxID=65515 RepID=UPI0033F6BC70
MCLIPASTDSRTVSRHRAASPYDAIVWTDPDDLARITPDRRTVIVQHPAALGDPLDRGVRRPRDVPDVGLLGHQPEHPVAPSADQDRRTRPLHGSGEFTVPRGRVADALRLSGAAYAEAHHEPPLRDRVHGGGDLPESWSSPTRGATGWRRPRGR